MARSRMATTTTTTVQLASDFILSNYSTRPTRNRALVVGIQGPQGSGKSYLAEQLERAPALAHLNVANVSLDDLYLPHAQLVDLARRDDPPNQLLQGRGQAGTHDVELGVRVLDQLRDRGESPVDVPRFDKSLHGGEGDRVEPARWTRVDDPVDVVLFEGWMLGFRPVLNDQGQLARVHDLARHRPARDVFGTGEWIDYDVPFVAHARVDDLDQVNRELERYQPLWDLVDVWVELRPEKLGYVWQWRLEQEHAMKAKNGGIGMTDQQVKTFISRYMPGYELFSSSSNVPKSPTTKNRGPLLTIELGKDRDIVGHHVAQETRA
ncbi:hypothetical protein JCM11491_005663 [Sporobolomyces phaffii]